MQPISASTLLERLKPAICCRQMVLVLSFALLIPAAAQAQYYYGRGGWGGYGAYGYGYGYGPYGGGPYGGYGDYGPDDEGPGPGPTHGGTANRGPAPAARDQGPGPKEADLVPLDVIKHRISAAGFRLIAPPRHKGNIYLAEVEDKNAVRHRLVYDAHDGHLIENTALGPVKKPSGPAEEGQPPKETKSDHSGLNEPGSDELAEQAKNAAALR